jgi:hypothetical protein
MMHVVIRIAVPGKVADMASVKSANTFKELLDFVSLIYYWLIYRYVLDMYHRNVKHLSMNGR